MTTQQPEALRLANILRGIDARSLFANEKLSAASAALENQHARITELESQLAQRFDAADMATASAQGFRDGATAQAQPVAEQANADSVLEDACHAPPLGWRCTRKAGHEGPCAAVEYEDDQQFVERGMQRIRDAEDAARYRLLRRGQHWSVIDGIGNDLRAEALDAAVDASRKQGEK